jgi:transposase
VESIKGHLINSPLAGFDETGFRVEGKLRWMHVASNALYTYITVHPKRGRAAIEQCGILPRFSGIAVHDCWKPYFLYTSCLHALCNAHLLRELTAVYEQTEQSWATDMLQLLLDMKADSEKLKQNGATFIPLEDMKVFRKAYENIICEGLSQNPLPERQEGKVGRLKRSKARCLLDRLIEHQEKILLFANDFEVPFDNNQSERDIRIFKVKQKVSGGLRSIDGAISFAKVTSYIQTAKKLGSNIFNALRSAFLGNSFDVVFG